MTHQNAVEEMAVERYLLGELTGAARDRFEEHLFDCVECAADLKHGVLFLEGARNELKSERTAQKKVHTEPRRPVAWFLQPWILAPALAACLAVMVYQSSVLLPRMRAEVAESQTPSVLTPLVLANAGARGGSTDSIANVVAPRHGFYLLSVDIPPAVDASSYRCSLYSPTGALVWHIDVSPQQARDAVTIQVPVMTADAGINELRVQSIPSARAKDSTLVDLARYRYKLNFSK
jgi:hypothetical protein